MAIAPGVVVVGAGAAGLSAAIQARRMGPDVTLVTDRALGRANSTLAQGGLHLPIDRGSEDRMIADMVASGGAEVSIERITKYVRRVRPTITELQQQGLALDRSDNGELRMRIAGGMSEARIVTAGDRIGPPVMKLLKRLASDLDVEVLENFSVEQVVRDGSRVLLQAQSGELRSSSVVIATGGTTWHHAQRTGAMTSNPANNNFLMTDQLTGLLGEVAETAFQWQPFGMAESVDPTGVGKLVPESIVGFDLKILDRKGSSVVDPKSGRLAVTTAMHEAQREGLALDGRNGNCGFLLTMSDIPVGELRRRYPNLHRRLKNQDLLGQDLLIAPFLHYQLGGFETGIAGETRVSGLFLAGEMTGGLHGQNRLMGNGLTESLVSGGRAGEAAALHAMNSLS